MIRELPSTGIMYKAMVEKDSSYEGVFYVAVKTTGVFCRPTCTARKPKPENVEFFSSPEEALDIGYRPCKICSPLELSGTAPFWVKELLKRVENSTGERWKDDDIKRLGFEPNRVRRWFKKNYNTTFISFMRTKRLGEAVNKIGNGEKVTPTAYTSGYESLSGFIDALKNLTGKAPLKSKEMNLLSIEKINTPLGPMFAGLSDEGLHMLEFEDRRMLKTQIKRITKINNLVPVIKKHKLHKEIEEQVTLYFEGKLKNFSLPLVVSGTEFQKKVWNELMKIPYGETISYEELAKRIGDIKAVRAVASANGFNSIGIVIPCHRVIGKDGNLRGYGGKVWRKKRLLELEKNFN